MKNYTIGIYFKSNLKEVALILKNRPEWQNGLYNFPGGHVEKGESNEQCVTREFYEECGILSKPEHWKLIGTIENENIYSVRILTAIHSPLYGKLTTMEDQEVSWFYTNNLPDNIINNLRVLIPLAQTFWQQGNNEDKLLLGKLIYG